MENTLAMAIPIMANNAKIEILSVVNTRAINAKVATNVMILKIFIKHFTNLHTKFVVTINESQ